ncbi:unnamed protein product [Rotaria socialis]|nr:unnamed protein product [Rotaria socialis]
MRWPNEAQILKNKSIPWRQSSVTTVQYEQQLLRQRLQQQLRQRPQQRALQHLQQQLHQRPQQRALRRPQHQLQLPVSLILAACLSIPTSIFSIIHGAGTTTTYQLYTNTFTPTSNVTTVTFAFQVDDDPGIWDLDDVSLKQTLGIELMLNGGFESGSLSPTWNTSCTVQCTGISSQGSGGGPGGISTVYLHTGTYNYRDRCNPEPKFDYLSQTITTVIPNQLCTLKYYLALYVSNNKVNNNFYVIIS